MCLYACEGVLVCVRLCVNTHVFIYVRAHTNIHVCIQKKSRKVKTLLFFLIVNRNLSSLDDQVYIKFR